MSEATHHGYPPFESQSEDWEVEERGLLDVECASTGVLILMLGF